jgi:hypothetical protein
VAQKDAAALAEMFKNKGELRRDAKRAAKQAGASDELAEFFDGLSEPELDTLIKTWDKMDELDLKGKSGGATVSFL